MAITAASLLVKVGYDDDQVDQGLKRTEGRVSSATVAIGSMVGNLAANLASQLPGAIMTAMTSMEDAMTPIGTLLGTQSAQYGVLADGIKEMVRNSPDSPEELGSAAYMILSAGITDTELALRALKDATDLADAGLGSVGAATDLITSAMNSFKGENLSSTEAAKLFYGTIASGKTTTAELAQGFGGIAPLAAAAGVSFKDLLAATAAITGTGAKASEAYSGLKGALSAIIKPSVDAATTAEELGIQFDQAHLAAVGLPAFLDEIKNATGGNVETMAKLFGGVEGLNAVMGLTGPLADAFASNLTNVSAAGENMAARAAETDQTLSARYATFRNRIMVVLQEIGVKGLDWLSAKWEAWGPTITRVLGQVGTAFQAMAAVFNGEASADSFEGLSGGFARFGEVARQVIDFIVVNAPKVRDTLTVVFGFISTEIVPRAITTFGLLQTNVDKVVEFIRVKFPEIREAVSQAFNYIVTEVLPSAIRYFDLVKEQVLALVAMVQEKWPQISAIFGQVVATIGPLAELLIAVFKRIVDFAQAYIDIMIIQWELWGDEIMRVVGWAFDIVAGMITGGLNVIQGIIKTFTALLNGDWSEAWEGIKQIFFGVWTQITTLFTGFTDAIKGIGKEAWDLIKTGAAAAWDEVVAGISGLGSRITDAASGIWDGIWEGFKDVINSILGAWNSLSFSVPSIDLGPFGGKIGGFSVGTTGIPLLAQGGSITHSGLAIVGDKGPELLSLNAGARVTPLPGGGWLDPMYGGDPWQITVNMPVGSNGDDVVRVLRRYQRRNGQVPIQTESRRVIR